MVLHYTVLDARASLERLCDPAAEVSCHWLVDRDGAVVEVVPEDRRAWHAGRSRWGMVRDVNARSVGIELVNDGREAFAEAQLAALEALLDDIAGRHAVPPERVLGHSDVAPGRKSDPGAAFPWRRLAAGGRAVRPSGPLPAADPSGLPVSLDRVGYDPDAPAPDRLAAFRLRFRPGAAGPADALDAGIAAEVAERWPCVDGARPGA